MPKQKLPHTSGYRRYYKGFIISYPAVQVDLAIWAVKLTSTNRKLQEKLDHSPDDIFTDEHRIESAISKAKQRVDELMM